MKSEKGRVNVIVTGFFILVTLTFINLVNMETIRGSVKEISIRDLTFEDWEGIRIYGYEDYVLSPGKARRIINNPGEFLIIEYDLKLNNISTWKKIYDIKLKPIFPKELKGKIFTYGQEKPESLTGPILIDAQGIIAIQKRIIIKKQQIDDHFLELLKQTRFEARGKVVLSQYQVNSICIGYYYALIDRSDTISIETGTFIED